MMQTSMLRKATAISSLAARRMSTAAKIPCPPMVYIKGEEMTSYCMELIMAKWVEPNIDTSKWEFYDLSCKARDDSEDKVLHDAVEAGARIKAIFKEPTVTPTAVQQKALGLKKAWGSPNGAMRRGWNGITISRDTIHIDGMELGYKRPVLFERHAVGGEYGAGYKEVGAGKCVTEFYPADGSPKQVVDERVLKDNLNAVVTYHNPLDNVSDLAHHFFTRCLAEEVTPYVVTKKTVFKWQEGFWMTMKNVFDAHYREDYRKAGLLDKCGGELPHLISDAATMQIIRWTDGGFGMAAHNYDGDMLTDEVAQVHRSPGFITSNLIGKADDGSMIKEYEASHGTVADMWEAHLRGEETSMNPLGMVEALIGAMNHAAALDGNCPEMLEYTSHLRQSMHSLMVAGQGTRDLCGPSGLTTEAFVDAVAEKLNSRVKPKAPVQPIAPTVVEDVDEEAMRSLFNELDTDGNGAIDYDELLKGLRKLGVHPRKMLNKNYADV
jgi:isocitrate dehydrogenase